MRTGSAATIKRALICLALATPAVSAATCAETASMVHSFAMLRDQHKPRAEVDAFIDRLPPPGGLAGSEVGAYVATLHKLAKLVYESPERSPAVLGASFRIFCERGRHSGAGDKQR